jgi:sensor histidine kinase regulating citrate/malate metabolism
VQDNGLGMDLSKTDAYKVFGLYRSLHDHVEGKGMGLFLVKTQIESLGGRVEIESQLDVGTTFHVYFPNEISFKTTA